MHINKAYLGQVHEEIVDASKPLVVTAIGHNRICSEQVISTVRPEGRSDYQLLYIASGKVRFQFNGQNCVVPRDHMVLYRPGEPQFYDLTSEEKPSIYWVHFTGSDVEQFLDYYQLPKECNAFYVGSKSDFPWLYNQMIRELQSKHTNFADALALHLQQIFLMINRHIQKENSMDAETSDLIEHATHYFHENYTQNIMIEDYARANNITPHWFTQAFKKVMKSTPMQYIISLRIKSAINLLEDTDYSIAQIAEAVGYDNPLYFSRIFKKHTGISPTEYRKKI